MNTRAVYLTREGYTALEQELKYLKTVKRQEVAQRLHAALSEGELIENAELEDARREQAFVEGRIIALDEQLRHATIIKEPTAYGVIGIGSHVVVREVNGTEEEKYHVVGSAEADPRKGKISNESPLGRALLSKRVGERAVVQAPAGDLTFEIINVE